MSSTTSTVTEYKRVDGKYMIFEFIVFEKEVVFGCHQFETTKWLSLQNWINIQFQLETFEKRILAFHHSNSKTFKDTPAEIMYVDQQIKVEVVLKRTSSSLKQHLKLDNISSRKVFAGYIRASISACNDDDLRKQLDTHGKSSTSNMFPNLSLAKNTSSKDNLTLKDDQKPNKKDETRSNIKEPLNADFSSVIDSSAYVPTAKKVKNKQLSSEQLYYPSKKVDSDKCLLSEYVPTVRLDSSDVLSVPEYKPTKLENITAMSVAQEPYTPLPLAVIDKSEKSSTLIPDKDQENLDLGEKLLFESDNHSDNQKSKSQDLFGSGSDSELELRSSPQIELPSSRCQLPRKSKPTHSMQEAKLSLPTRSLQNCKDEIDHANNQTREPAKKKPASQNWLLETPVLSSEEEVRKSPRRVQKYASKITERRQICNSMYRNRKPRKMTDSEMLDTLQRFEEAIQRTEKDMLTNELSCKHLSSAKIIETFEEFSKELDTIFHSNCHSWSESTSFRSWKNNQIEPFEIFTKQTVEELFTFLDDRYNKNIAYGISKIDDLLINVMIPEWAVLICTKEFKMDRERVIQRLKEEKDRRMLLLCEEQ